MGLGFGTARDALEVLIVPVLLALLAVLWPANVARLRKKNFEQLIRRELAEAAPRSDMDARAPWHQHLTRRFLHEQIIGHPVENTDFVLSLNPELSYHLSQMWIEFGKAEAEKGQSSSEHAHQFCWHLGKAARFLDQKRHSDLTRDVWEPWKRLVDKKIAKT